MSWSTGTNGPINKSDLAAFDFKNLYGGGDIALGAAVADQIEAGRRAALEIAKTVPGPKISVSMSGHANAVGYQKKEGYANDCITVSVTQWCDGDWVPGQ
jgi:hypothetical protein